MGVSLETRVPFLDNRVIEAAWKVLDMVRNGVGKWCLRELISAGAKGTDRTAKNRIWGSAR